MDYCKVQLGCLLIVSYIVFIYKRECKKYHKKLSSSIFDELMVLGIVSIALDGITAITVNHLDSVNITLNRILHLLFLLSIDTVIYMMFGYMVKMTGFLPQNRVKRFILNVPYLINVLIVVLNIGNLEFIQEDDSFKKEESYNFEGLILKDVIPSVANASIFFSGYLDSPAKRSWRA